MNQGQGYLLAMFCLLVSLAPAQAQPRPTANRSVRSVRSGQIAGFVPKHEKILRLRQAGGTVATRRRSPPADRPNSSTNSIENPFAEPIQPITVAESAVRQISFNQPTTEFPIQLAPHSQCDDCIGCVDPTCGVPSWGAPTCGVAGCTSCGSSCYQPMFWVSADYLLWSTREAATPALASTSDAGTLRDEAGVLDEPGVSTLFGGDGFHGDVRSGVRFTLGGWFSPQQTAGIEVAYFSFEEDTESFSAGLSDFPILARPFFNMQLFEEDSRLVNFPNLVRGDLSIRSLSDFDSLEIMFLRPAASSRGYTHLMAGYRNVNLDETIRFDETTTSLASPTLDSTFALFDEFAVENSYHGGQIGVHHVRQMGNCWSLDLIGKASLGSTRSRIRIDGQTTTTTSSGDTSSVAGGLLAQGTNIGSHSDSDFGSIFELGFNLHRRFNNGLQFRIGYTYLHWSNVARAIEQIDRDINPTQVPPDTLSGSPRPRVPFERSGFWAQGLNVGLEYQF